MPEFICSMNPDALERGVGVWIKAETDEEAVKQLMTQLKKLFKPQLYIIYVWDTVKHVTTQVQYEVTP